MGKGRESNCVFRLTKLGLVIIEHTEKPDHFLIVRPTSVSGSTFRGWRLVYTLAMCRTHVETNAPTARLAPCAKGWEVDISEVGVPERGPVWFHEQFESAEDAVTAIEQCYFGNRVDNNNYSLERFFGTRFMSDQQRFRHCFHSIKDDMTEEQVDAMASGFSSIAHDEATVATSMGSPHLRPSVKFKTYESKHAGEQGKQYM